MSDNGNRQERGGKAPDVGHGPAPREDLRETFNELWWPRPKTRRQQLMGWLAIPIFAAAAIVLALAFEGRI